jgi:Phage integrase family
MRFRHLRRSAPSVYAPRRVVVGRPDKLPEELAAKIGLKPDFCRSWRVKSALFAVRFRRASKAAQGRSGRYAFDEWLEDLGLVIHRNDDGSTLFRVAKSRDHRVYGEPGDVNLTLARPRGRTRLGYDLRIALHEIAAAAGIRTRIVPHQFRHSFATEMLRAGVSLPVLMKLLGHKSPKMTLRYLEVSLSDVQREFQLAQLNPRHLAPAPKAPSAVHAANLSSLLDSLQVTQHVLEMFRRTLPDGPYRRVLERLANRLTKIASEARAIDHP